MLNPAPEIRFFTARDGYRWAARVWEAQEVPARLVCLHGVISHGGWYLASSAHLASAGFAVHFLERRGSGLNTADRGHARDYETCITDVEDYLEALPEDAPKILLGISWGGILATAVARRRPDLLAGVGLICPGLYSRVRASPLARFALRAARRIGLKRRKIAIPLREPALFTDSPVQRAYIAADPLTLREMTLSFASATVDLTRYATEAPEELRVPTLVMLAGRDPIVDNARVRRHFDRLGHRDNRLVEYADASHTLEFEPGPTRYFEDLRRWCAEVGGKR